MKSFIQYITEDDDTKDVKPQTFSTTRRELMGRRFGEENLPGYLDALKKYREQHAEELAPFALPSITPGELDKPIQIQYGPLGSFPGDPTPDENAKNAGGRGAAGWASSDPKKPDVRILPDYEYSRFAMGELQPSQIVSKKIWGSRGLPYIPNSPVPVVGQPPLKMRTDIYKPEEIPTEIKKLADKKGDITVTTHAPSIIDPVYDILGHEAAHIGQEVPPGERERVVPPLPGDTPENKQYRDYIFNTTEPAVRANEAKAWLARQGYNVRADMSDDEYQTAMNALKISAKANPNSESLKANLEFWSTPQGQALFRGAKANTPGPDPKQNQRVNGTNTPTAIAEAWNQMRLFSCKKR